MSGKVDRAAPPHSGSTAFINARIVDPTADTEYVGAVLISDGKIADFGPNLFASGAPYGIQSVDCRGFYLAPGLVDARVHTGEPGEEHKETLESAGIAAAAGGDRFRMRKPDPGHLLGALELAGGDPARALMSGDHHNDVAAAAGARVRCVFAAWGYGDRGQGAEAAAIAEDFSDLVRLAEALLPPGGP